MVTTPTAPTDLLTDGQVNPTGVTDTSPKLSAVYTDTASSETAAFYRVQVSSSST